MLNPWLKNPCPIQIRSVVAAVLTTSFLGFLTPQAKAQSKPTVVVTTSILCDITKRIAQDTIALKCLLNPGADPHVYSPKPQDRKAIETAKLIVYGGYDFEPDLIRLIQSTSNPAPKVAVHEMAVPNPISGGHHHHGDGGHHHGAGSNKPDPHVFHSAANGTRMVSVVQQSLTKLNPSQRSRYAANAKKLSGELSQIHTWIRSQIKTIPFKQRWIISTHDAFEYYARTYNLGLAPTLRGISTEERPSAFRVAQLAREVKTLGVPTIFAETTVNPKLITIVANEAKVKVSPRKLYADGIGKPGSEADSYSKMLIANTRAIVEGLGGKYTPPR
jgi:manganese/iron transport system substrate-binding protein